MDNIIGSNVLMQISVPKTNSFFIQKDKSATSAKWSSIGLRGPSFMMSATLGGGGGKVADTKGYICDKIKNEVIRYQTLIKTPTS